MFLNRVVAGATASLILSACEHGTDHQFAVVRDSAGIRIVENYSPEWGSGEAWMVSAVPILEIRGDELHRVRMPLRLSNGRIAFANAGTEVRYYDETGALLSTSGRQGRGPGEFTDLQLLFRYPGDSLLAWDTDGSLAGTVLDPEGVAVRTIALPARVDGQRTSLVEHVLADGTLIGALRPPDNPWPEQRIEGRDFAVRTYARYTSEGRRPTLLGTFLNGVCVRRNDLPWCYPDQFGAFGAFAAGTDYFYTAFPEQFAIEARDSTGTVELIIRREYDPVVVTPEQVAAYRRDLLASARPEWRESVEKSLDEARFPDLLPAFVTMIVDGTDHLWVREAVDLRMLRGSSIYPPPTLDVPATWSVFEPTGAYLGTVILPEQLQVTDIGDDYVLGVSTDSLGVESVRMYGLRKRP